MTVDREALRLRWIDERPQYDEYRRQVESEIRDLISEHGLPYANITGRTKTVDSFVRKFDLHEGKDSYESIHDKAGVRVVVYLREQVDPTVSLIRYAYGVPESDVDDKRVFPDGAADRFTYRSVHLQARGQLGGPSDDKECEIQVRTVCEDAWAVMSHFLAYKPENPVPDDVRRTQAALSALMELADMQYEVQYRTLKQLPSYDMREVLEQVASMFERLTGIASEDRDVSDAVFAWLRPAWGSDSSEEILAKVQSYAERHGEGFSRRLLERVDQPSRSSYLRAPEALLVAERFEAGLGGTVRELWGQHLPDDEFMRLTWDLGLADDE